MFGNVKWFNEEKGFGFINSEDKTYFVHFSSIKTDGFKTLQQGDEVTFTPSKNAKGDCAIDVKKVID